jgi:hypothetical protein
MGKQSMIFSETIACLLTTQVNTTSLTFIVSCSDLSTSESIAYQFTVLADGILGLHESMTFVFCSARKSGQQHHGMDILYGLWWWKSCTIKVEFVSS